MNKINIEEAIVVEGRDDAAVVRQVTDAVIIETHGFGIKRETWELLQKAYEEKGLIILTDPDFSGEEIRRKLSERFPDSKHVYMSREKTTKKGDIGIENSSPEEIFKSLKKICTPKKQNETEGKSQNIITMEDMLRTGLYGGRNSVKMRELVGEALGIGYGNCKAFLKKLKGFGIDRRAFEDAVERAERVCKGE